jgi:neutral ceramidase
MTTVDCGVATRDVTPPAGRAMSGFVARTPTATRTHDPLTVRALCVGETAVVTVDVVGLHEDTCAEIRRRCPLPDDAVLVHATHTHGGPASMPGRLGGNVNRHWLEHVVDASVDAVQTALDARVNAVIRSGYGRCPGIATNRRHAGGPVDGRLPVVEVEAVHGGTLAVLVAYACHPVVLGPDNTEWTADYPWALRRLIEKHYPGAVAIFLTGCAGDANTGHTAAASLSSQPSTRRTFAEAERIGEHIGSSACAAVTSPSGRPIAALHDRVELALTTTPQHLLTRNATTWAADAARAGATPSQRALWRCWAEWAAGPARDAVRSWTAPVTVLRWGSTFIVALPGEPFAVTGKLLRRAAEAVGARTVLVAGYTNGCPGYLPPREEYAHGGYEVNEAHRYYGMPGAFDAAAVDALEACAVDLIDRTALANTYPA